MIDLFSDIKRFGSIGDYISNDWQESQNGEDYRSRIGEAGRPDLQGWVDGFVAKVAQVNKDFAARYGWGKASPEGSAQKVGLPIAPLQAGGQNYVVPHISSFVPKDVLDRADSYIARYYVDKPPVEINPADRAKAENLLRPLLLKADAIKPMFDQKVLDIENKSAAIGVQLPPNKKLARAAEKLVTEENFNVKGMKDLVRATIVVNRYSDAQSVIDEISKQFDIMRIKNRSGVELTGKNLTEADRADFGGYSDVLVNVILPNGVIGEIQINVPSMLSAKTGHGHKLYEAAREASEPGLQKEILYAGSELYDHVFPGRQTGGVSRIVMPSRGSPPAGKSSVISSENLNTSPDGISTNSSPPNVGTNLQPGGNFSGTGNAIFPPPSRSIANTEVVGNQDSAGEGQAGRSGMPKGELYQGTLRFVSALSARRRPGIE